MSFQAIFFSCLIVENQIFKKKIIKASILYITKQIVILL